MELRRRVAIAGVLVFASVMLIGRPARAADPCSLLTLEQAAAALGVPDVNAGASANRCVSGLRRNMFGEQDSSQFSWKVRTMGRR